MKTIPIVFRLIVNSYNDQLKSFKKKLTYNEIHKYYEILNPYIRLEKTNHFPRFFNNDPLFIEL